MMNQDNGKAVIGNSDVYIDNAYNFYGPSCSMSNLGKKRGLGNMSAPVLDGVSPRTAVEPGNGYQIFRDEAIREFPSGKLAVNIAADYYNVFVVSQIMKDGDVTGANVKFVLMDVPRYGLPEYNKNIGTLYSYSGDGMELSIDLPTSDFEYEPVFASSSFYTLEHEKVGNKLIVRVVDFRSSDIFGFHIRIKNSYTYVYGTVE